MPDVVFVLMRTNSCSNERLLRKKVFSYYLGRNRDYELDSGSNLGYPWPGSSCVPSERCRSNSAKQNLLLNLIKVGISVC